MNTPTATLRAGISEKNSSLYHVMRFAVGDPAAWLEIPQDGGTKTILIIRDVELDRARATVQADEIVGPADYTPEDGLSADREVATAQAVAECFKRHGITTVTGERSLPLCFVQVLTEAGLEVVCDLALGVRERRQKTEEEIAMIRHSQAVTEEAIRLACEMIARADVGDGGVLQHEGSDLTSERVRAAVNTLLMDRGFSGPQFIIAGGPHGAIGHHIGHGPLRTGESVIVDIYPTDRSTHYCGDCTRTVVHGDIPDEIAAMHATVVKAKAAAIAAVRAGATGKDVHAATSGVIVGDGYAMATPGQRSRGDGAVLDHGTGHGIGLDVHEPPLLDAKGIELIPGDAVTIEPGLYKPGLGGVRVEDIVIVTEDGCENLNSLPEGLDWS